MSRVLSVLGSIVRGHIRGVGSVTYVGRYVEYVNPASRLLNSPETGAVFDPQPSGIFKPFHK